mgnify:CR=1 FL=1
MVQYLYNTTLERTGDTEATMKKLLDWANGCIRRWDWKDVALLKFCMLALGVLVGLPFHTGAAAWQSRSAPRCF